MTCIVGIEHDGKVYLGSDSIAILDYNKRKITEPKCFKNINNDEFIFGYTTSFRFGQLIQYSFVPPKKLDIHKSDMHFLCTTFIDELRNVLKIGGWCKIFDESTDEGGKCLIGYNKTLYLLDCDFQIIRPYYGYAAVGAGSIYAESILHYLKDKDMNPQDKLVEALTVSSELNAAVIPPFHFITL